MELDRKSTRLNSSHTLISYAVFCLKKKTQHRNSLRQGGARWPLLSASEGVPRCTIGLVDAPPVLAVRAAVSVPYFLFFFFNDTATTEIYTLSLHDALPIYSSHTLISYAVFCLRDESVTGVDRKSTRLHSSHTLISYAVFSLKTKSELLVTAWREIEYRAGGQGRAGGILC